MHFECPNCHQRLEIENDRAGELLPCPACERSIRVPKAPIVIYKGLHGHKGLPGRGGMRLVPIARQHRQGSLAGRMAAMKAAQAQPPADTDTDTDTGQDGPMLL